MNARKGSPQILRWHGAAPHLNCTRPDRIQQQNTTESLGNDPGVPDREAMARFARSLLTLPQASLAAVLLRGPRDGCASVPLLHVRRPFALERRRNLRPARRAVLEVLCTRRAVALPRREVSPNVLRARTESRTGVCPARRRGMRGEAVHACATIYCVQPRNVQPCHETILKSAKRNVQLQSA